MPAKRKNDSIRKSSFHNPQFIHSFSKDHQLLQKSFLIILLCMHAKPLQSYPTLCDHSLPGSSVHGILQTRTLEWTPMPSPRGCRHPGMESASLMSPALAAGIFTTRTTWEAHVHSHTTSHRSIFTFVEGPT